MSLHAPLATICLAVLVPVSHSGDGKPAPKGVEGYWQGNLTDKLLFVIKVAKEKDNTWTGDLDSPNEKLEGLALSKVEFKDKKLVFELKLTNAVYEGKLNDKETEIAGVWKARGGELPLTFKRLLRPQEPKRPYAYIEEEVVFENAAARVKLAGTLTLPRGKGPFPAAVLLSGSGPQDRDETIFRHKPFLLLADHLTRQGIAVLRYDDRGVAKSTGDHAKATTGDFAGDAAAAVAFLKKHKAIQPGKIGLIGHSEGGAIAPIVAVKDRDVAFIVLLAGTGFTGEEILFQQLNLVHDKVATSKAKRDWAMKLQKDLNAIIKAEEDEAVIIKKVNAIALKALQQAPDRDKKDTALALQSIAQELHPSRFAWMRFWFNHDPRPVLAQVKCPVLALNGTNDWQVIPENLKEIAKALEKGGNKDVTVKELPGLNHLFQTCKTSKTGDIFEYLHIEETIAPAVLELVASWVKNRTGL